MVSLSLGIRDGPDELLVVVGVSPDGPRRVGLGVDEELMSTPGEEGRRKRKEGEGSKGKERSGRELSYLCFPPEAETSVIETVGETVLTLHQTVGSSPRGDLSPRPPCFDETRR